MTPAARHEAEMLVRRLLQLYGDDPDREGLLETPKRVVASWEELFSGYGRKPEEVLKVFDADTDELVLVKDIQFYSRCEHHDQPFFGLAHVGYIPDGKVIGMSKLPRLVEIYARRLQIQETLTTQIADSLFQLLNPKGVACVVEATHLCACARGVRQPEAKLVTSRMLGVFREKPEARHEFLTLIRSK